MTACVNKKHSRRVAAAVSASLVGALTLGAAPAVVMAEEAPVETQWLDPEGAFAQAEVVATFKHGTSHPRFDSHNGKDTYATTTFIENDPVVLDSVEIDVFGDASERDDKLTIDPNDGNDYFDVTYHKYNFKTQEVGDEVKGGPIAVGEYVAVVTALEDSGYEGGVVYIPFKITPKKINTVEVMNDVVTYNGEAHTGFKIQFNGEDVTEGIDYDVFYVQKGHGATESQAVEVKNAGEYRAVVMAKGNWEGTRKESDNTITVEQLDVSNPNVYVEGLVTDDLSEIENPYAIWIDGVRYSGEDAIMGELHADLADDEQTFLENGKYEYNLGRADANNKNITDDTVNFFAYKVDQVIPAEKFTYDGAQLAESYDWIKSQPKTAMDLSLLGATDGLGNKFSVADGTLEFVAVFDENGDNKNGTHWWDVNGSYTVIFRTTEAAMQGAKGDWVSGGYASTVINVYSDAIDVDAAAVVSYKNQVVTSISATYDPMHDVTDDIKVRVKKSDGTFTGNGLDIRYFNADGIEVKEIVDAGTYTMRVTSKDYKLTGTTEMTITVGKLDISEVKSATVQTESFDKVGSGVDYLPWRENGFALTGNGTGKNPFGLNLQYKDADGKWQTLDLRLVLITITNEDGEEVDKLTDEGVYTLHFEPRYADAEANYVLPEDLTVTVIKDGTNGGDKDANHLKYSDVRYTDYFADPVDWISDPARAFMTGYKDTRVFGSLDQLTRGQVACVLFNMASLNHHVDESSLKYNELFGYDTGFEDVDGKAYYGKAVAWAAQAGVVNGYKDGTFHADQAVTRQEFACMLANYAKKYGTFEAPSADAMGEMSDAKDVAAFAEESVAWAVENGIIGNSGYVAPNNTIIRADAACMVYNYAK